ncbi:MAG TPA: Imm32 family immunity protein [Candidatus Binatia bacterium]
MADFLLSFELDEKSSCLEIHGDPAGLQRLSTILSKLVAHTRDGHFDHDHLMTPAWGGNELSEENKGGNRLNHVKIYCWKGEKFQT